MADPNAVKIPVLGFDSSGNAITTTVSVGGVNTGAEIKALYEGEANTNAFTDSEKAKLAGIETGASADMSGAEIKTAYEGEADTNAFTDSEKAKLAGIEAGAKADQTGPEIISAINSELGGTAWQSGGAGGTGSGTGAIPLQVPAFAVLASPPKYKYINGLPFQLFNEGDAVKWPIHIPQGFGPSLVLKVLVAMETASSGTLNLAASVDAISPNDSQIVSKETYDAANNAAVNVPSTPETLTEVAIPIAFADNLSAGDIVRLRLERSNGTAPGGMWLLGVALTSAS